MKKEIHPKVNINTKVTCACGNTFETMSTLDEISVDICSNCHPFFTGQQKFIDTEGRIEKFQKKVELAKEKQKAAGKNKSKKEKNSKPTSLKDLLAKAKKNS